jgi:hypothetical protein
MVTYFRPRYFGPGEIPPWRRVTTPMVVADLVPAGAAWYETGAGGRHRTMFSMLLSFGPEQSCAAFNSDRLRTRQFRHRAHFLPPDTTFAWEPHATPDYLALAVDGDFARAVLAADTDGRRPVERVMLRNAPRAVLHLGSILRDRMQQGRPPGALELECHTVLWLHAWLAVLDCDQAAPRDGGPALRMLARVD